MEMLRRYKLKNINFKLILYVLLLTAIGVMAVGSARESLQQKQLYGAIAGCVTLLICALIDYHVWLKLYWGIYVLNIILLILVKVMGTTRGGAQRWIQLFGIQFQPSETAKIMMIVFLAAFAMKHEEDLNRPRNLLLLIAFFAPVLFLIYKQPDMSTSIMLCVLFAIILFESGLSWKIVIGFLGITIPTLIIALALVLQPGQNLIEQYQQDRILSWLNPTEYANTEAYQQINSVTAIGSGELYGKGYKNNEVSSVKNGNFISEPQTDFIFAVIGEEFGFVGTTAVIVLLILIAFECIIVARKSSDLAGTIIASAMGGLIAFQGFMNIGVATQVLPNTGIPLPFVSYGLTSLVSLYAGIGFVLNVRLLGNNQRERGVLL